MIARILQKVATSTLSLLFPPLCLHCQQTLEKGYSIFCRTCQNVFQPLDPALRCPYCFSPDFSSHLQKCCHRCIEHPLMLDRVAAAFDYEGPPATLVRQLKYGGQLHLAKGAAAFMVAQYVSLDCALPDLIIPMPMPRLRRWERGFNQSMLIAEAFGKMVGRPVVDLLKRKSGSFSQAGLDHERRLQIDGSSFCLREERKLYGKSVLLIDDVITTGSSLRCCAEVLRPLFPDAIHALTLCCAVM